MKNNEPTNQEILEAINNFAGHTEGRFSKIEEKFDSIDKRFEKMDQRFDKIEKELVAVKSYMVTKDYLDIKLADLRGDLVLLTRKEDTKLKTLVDVLCDKKVINEKDRKKIFKMEPFAELMV
jgi:predicted nuclease with TOPRIM domain